MRVLGVKILSSLNIKLETWARMFKTKGVVVNVSLNSEVNFSSMPIFWLKTCDRLLQCKSFSHFFNKKFQCIWL